MSIPVIFSLAVLVLGAMVVLGALVMLIVPIIKGIVFLIGHVFGVVFGVIADAIRMVSAVLAGVWHSVLAILNVLIGRWSSANRHANAAKEQLVRFGWAVFRIIVGTPLFLLFIAKRTNPLTETGWRVHDPRNEDSISTVVSTSKNKVMFPGFEIVGSLPPGGSGAKLYIARPVGEGRTRSLGLPERVVIKSFALAEGSTLPQIVRESRSLEAARRLGLVLDHELETDRFWYAMPYHDGPHLGMVIRDLHALEEGDGIGRQALHEVLGYQVGLVRTLATYHADGLWHKDVKPDNVIIEGGHAHLVDLGLVTSLASAMTLTTHGTEYFRDPEMVRMALEGVKVHQVNGAKFDIYGAGAVLYFMLENTFPAHGGLSRFAKRSPEVVRWIVRRAMTDYDSRYETADEMLADLRAVVASDDPWAMKPASLPSMRGGVSAPPPRMSRAANTIAPPLTAGRRPRLKVVNWWSGAYRLSSPVNRRGAGVVPSSNVVSSGIAPEGSNQKMSGALVFLVLGVILVISSGMFVYLDWLNQQRTLGEAYRAHSASTETTKGLGIDFHESLNQTREILARWRADGAKDTLEFDASTAWISASSSEKASDLIEFTRAYESMVSDFVEARNEIPTSSAKAAREALQETIQLGLACFGEDMVKSVVGSFDDSMVFSLDINDTVQIKVDGVPIFIPTGGARYFDMDDSYPGVIGDGRYLVVNDHSNGIDPSVKSQVAGHVQSLNGAGWIQAEHDMEAVAAVLVALLQSDHSLQDAPFDPVAGALRSLDLDGVLWIRDGNEPEEYGVSIDAQFIAPPLDDGTKVNSSRRSDGWLDPLSGPWLLQPAGFPHEVAHERLVAA